MGKELRTTFLGVSTSCLLWIALLVLLIVGGAGFTVWYNYHIAVPVANSERYVQTCNQSYLTSQKARIENDLSAISNNDIGIASTSSEGLKLGLKMQQKTNADDIYNALDSSQCSRSQIIADMPELQSFFSQYPTR